jgi:hypothetical protein
MPIRLPMRWWLVSIINRGTGRVEDADVDAIYVDRTSEAIEIARQRNPLRPWQDVCVSPASEDKRALCCMINEQRTSEILSFIEFMSD